MGVGASTWRNRGGERRKSGTGKNKHNTRVQLSYSFRSRRRVLHVICAWTFPSPARRPARRSGGVPISRSRVPLDPRRRNDLCAWCIRPNADSGGEGFMYPLPPLGRHYFRAKGDRVIGGGVRWGSVEPVAMPAHYVCMAECAHHYIIRCSGCVYEILGAPWVIIIISLPLVYILWLLLLKYYIPFQFARRKNFRFPFIRTDGVWA